MNLEKILRNSWHVDYLSFAELVIFIKDFMSLLFTVSNKLLPKMITDSGVSLDRKCWAEMLVIIAPSNPTNKNLWCVRKQYTHIMQLFSRLVRFLTEPVKLVSWSDPSRMKNASKHLPRSHDHQPCTNKTTKSTRVPLEFIWWCKEVSGNGWRNCRNSRRRQYWSILQNSVMSALQYYHTHSQHSKPAPF